ncbi:hypothetical protein F3F59_30775 [Bacteroides ovatus]|nr:hypothetical protein F3F59_30775 [Bacteroides ovatus]
MSDVRQLTPAACILVTLPYRSLIVFNGDRVSFTKTYVRKKTLAAQKKEEAEKRQLSLGFDEL